jgi:hypothetical protein
VMYESSMSARCTSQNRAVDAIPVAPAISVAELVAM